MPGYTVVTEALQKESEKWVDLSASLDAVRVAANDLVLNPTAFFIGDANTLPHYAAYQHFQKFMVEVLAGGTNEFQEIGQALLRIKRTYDEAEGVIDFDLNEIFSA